jgi:hypothetical protein
MLRAKSSFNTCDETGSFETKAAAAAAVSNYLRVKEWRASVKG